MKNPQTEGRSKRQRQRAKERHFLLGVRCGAHVSMHLMKSGWADLEGLEREVVSRVTGEQDAVRRRARGKM
jgi:hypothetical protein